MTTIDMEEVGLSFILDKNGAEPSMIPGIKAEMEGFLHKDYPQATNISYIGPEACFEGCVDPQRYGNKHFHLHLYADNPI